eukprot:m.79804 g.79804  ORF g.79804 m.79804 type:complete len:386 (+) comp36152_c0_seq1:31-1188(+)
MPWKFRDEDWYRVTFVYKNENAKTVSLVGDFCGWNPNQLPMNKIDGEFRITIPLIEGYYKYKFFVDESEWLADPNNPHHDAEFGNSIMFVHMDPAVCVPRDCHPPHRDYHRPYADGSQFQIIHPEVTSDIASYGIIPRPVFVYLPLSYSQKPEVHYPVLYIHDGQNVFSTPGDKGGPVWGGWYLDEKLDRMWSDGSIREFVLVAVPSVDCLRPGNRMREYCTKSFLQASSDPFLRYLVECVKPEVDRKFRTLPEPESTASMGASMGGLISFTLAVTYGHVFGNAACLSPSFWFADCHNITAFDLLRSVKKVRSHVYLDSGDGQGDNMYETLQMAELMKSLGWEEGKDYLYFLDACAERKANQVTHSEDAWRDRIHLPLKFIFGKS